LNLSYIVKNYFFSLPPRFLAQLPLCNANMATMFPLRRVNFQTFIAQKEKVGSGGDKFVINDQPLPSAEPLVQARSTLIL
jgi:hypothetical protein